MVLHRRPHEILAWLIQAYKACTFNDALCHFSSQNRKVSQVTNASTDRSPSSVFSSHVFTVDIEPSSPDRLNYYSAARSPTGDTEAAAHTPSSLNTSREPFAPVFNRGRSSQASPDSNVGGARRDSTADNLSELSFTSAYSNPVTGFHGDNENMETTV